MKKYLIAIIFLTISFQNFAQNAALKKRYSFAQTYVGVDLNRFSSLQESAFLNSKNELQPFDRHNFSTPAINIGGTHFWGYTDFFVSISTISTKTSPDLIKNSIRFKAITGLRLYPSPLKNNTLRPYVSYKFAPIRLNQENILGENYRKTQVKSIIGAGIAYRSSHLYTYAGYEFIPNASTSIYINRNQTTASSFPKGLVSVGINYLIDFTKDSYKGNFPRLDSTLQQESKFGWFIGIGPSSAFPLKNSSYITKLYPFLDNKSMPNIFPELTLGYHFSKKEWILAANYRPIKQIRQAFGFNQQINRNSLGVEIYKFLFDYHGFTPFFGIGSLYENLQLKETNQDQTTHQDIHTITPSLVAGWDIRPNKRADLWLLRTNLRYSPYLNITKNNQTLNLSYLEFNFIQFVLYPQRIRAYKNLTKQ